MKVVLWISRHKMTSPQLEDLQRIMKEPIKIRQWPDTVHNVEDLRPAVKQADAIAAVLPPELLSRLFKLANGKPILQAVSGRVPTGRFFTLTDGRTEPEFAYTHRCWQQIIRLDIETKIL